MKNSQNSLNPCNFSTQNTSISSLPYPPKSPLFSKNLQISDFHSSIILNSSNLKQSTDHLTSQNESLHKTISDLKKEITELKEKSDKDRTLFAQEQHSKRIQEQKLLQALDSLSRLKKQKSQNDEDLKAEYKAIKENMEKIQEKVEKVHELEDSLHARDDEIQSLKRKCKALEREISLLQDELDSV